MLVAFALGLVASLLTGFLKALQIKNITTQSYKLAVVTSIVMKALDIAILGVIAKSAVSGDIVITAIPIIIGGALGVISAMYVHEKYVKIK